MPTAVEREAQAIKSEAKKILLIVVIISVLIYAFSGTAQVGEEQTGLVIRFGTIAKTLKEGLYLGYPWPIDKVVRIPTGVSHDLDVKNFNLDPKLLRKMKIRQLGETELEVPVTTMVPAACMGSGIGSAHVAKGDYDIVTSDPETVEKYHLDKIRFGDFVALIDNDNRYGRAYRQGAVTIGIVVHSDCLIAGHGPGVTTLMTCGTSLIKPVIDPQANIADLLKVKFFISPGE